MRGGRRAAGAIFPLNTQLSTLNSLRVRSAVGDGEIDSPVRPHLHAVHVVPAECDVDAKTRRELRLRAVGRDAPEVGHAGVNRAAIRHREHACAESGFEIVEAAREHARLVRATRTGAVLDDADLLRFHRPVAPIDLPVLVDVLRGLLRILRRRFGHLRFQKSDALLHRAQRKILDLPRLIFPDIRHGSPAALRHGDECAALCVE